MSVFAKTCGEKIVFGDKELRLKGFGIGTWLNMEHFMLGLPTPDSMIQAAVREVFGKKVLDAFIRRFIDSFIREEDFLLLKKCGINFIRVPFNYRLFIDDNQIDFYREIGFEKLKYLLDLCEKHKIFVMPDLHTSPGGQNPDWHSDNRSGDPQFWQFELFRNQIVELWGEIARRFSHYSYLLGYDLLNEPAMAKKGEINSFHKKAVAEIRKYDTHHAIILEGAMFSMDFREIEIPKDDNIILSFHYYPTVWHKALLDKSLDRKARFRQLEDALKKLVSIRDEFQLPVICGEAGYDWDKKDPKFSQNLLEDTFLLFHKFDLHFAIWAYKDYGFMAMMHPKRDTPWIRFTDKIRKNWSHYDEMGQADRLIRRIGNEFGGLSEDKYYVLQFRLRGILYEMQKEKILLPHLSELSENELLDLADSFRIENCEALEGYIALVQKYCLGHEGRGRE